MTTITVDTAADTVANDGKTSLREAIAQAENTAGHVEIRFDEATFFNPTTYAITVIQLSETLVIKKGDIAIDGSLFFGGSFYGIKLSGAALASNAITVEANARVTLRDLTLQGSPGNSVLIKGQYGADGHNGTNGVNGVGIPDGLPTRPPDGMGVSGTDGTDAGNAPNDAEDGRIAVGAIINRGTLTLERVNITSFKTEGGAGGNGGNGGKGGKGGNGEPGSAAHHSGGDGGDGGHSGDGANGGIGGDAVAGIYNVGTLTLRDTSFGTLVATGGKGGQGGDGERGGHGGSWGRSDYDTIAQGGDGGDGGDGGNGGRGGVAASAVFNAGQLTIDGVQSKVLGTSLQGGLGGSAGDFGQLGVHGGAYASSFDYPQNGLDGEDGVKGALGANGTTGDFVGASVATGASFIIDGPKTVVSDTATDDHSRTVYVSVRLLGAEAAGTKSVKWSFEGGDGVTASDFGGGVLPTGGTLEYSGTTGEKFFGFLIAKDSKAEGIETFTIKLSAPEGGALGWSKSVTIAIVDGDTSGHAPETIKLNGASASEDAARNTRVGKLSTTDDDAGDRFTYSLIDSAGGRFKIAGSEIRVANGVLLDYEQARSHKIVVRSTDLFGNSTDKSITVKVTDVARENVTGDGAANKIVGGAQADTVDGRLGNDTLTGRGSDDIFVFSTPPNALSNLDHVTDFASGYDLLKLDRDVFSGLSKGKLPADAFHAGAGAADREDRIIYRNDGTLLWDKDGNKPGGAAAIAFAVLDHHPKLAAGGFLVF